MTITKKIETEFIKKGADVVSDRGARTTDSVDVCVRMPKNMMRRIDAIRDEGVSRNAWIREAISDRLQRMGG